MNITCCIDTCGYVSREDCERHFHRFPLDNKPLLDSWLNAIGADKNLQPNLNTFICSAHFSANDYVLENGIFEISQDAVPSKIKYENVENIEENLEENVESSDNTNDEVRHCGAVTEIPVYNMVNNQQAKFNNNSSSPIITKVEGNYSSNSLTGISLTSNNIGLRGNRYVKITNANNAANTNFTSGAKKNQKVVVIKKNGSRTATSTITSQNGHSSNLQLSKNLEYNNNKASTSKNTLSYSPSVSNISTCTITTQNGNSSNLQLSKNLEYNNNKASTSKNTLSYSPSVSNISTSTITSQNGHSSNLQSSKNLEYNSNKASTSKNTISYFPTVSNISRISNPVCPSTSTNQNIKECSSDLRLGEDVHTIKKPPFLPGQFNTYNSDGNFNPDKILKNKLIKKNTPKNTQTDTNTVWLQNKSNVQYKDKISDQCIKRMRKLARQNKRLTSKLNELMPVKEELLDMQIKYMELKAKVLETEEKLLKNGIDTSEYSAFCLAVDSHVSNRYNESMEELNHQPSTNCNSTSKVSTTTNAQTSTENKNVHQNMMEC